MSNNPPATVFLIPPKLASTHLQNEINALINLHLNTVIRKAYSDQSLYPVAFESDAWRKPEARGGSADTAIYDRFNSLPVLMLQCDINAGIVSVWCGGWSLSGPRSPLAPVVTVPVSALVTPANSDSLTDAEIRQMATGVFALIGVTMLGQLDAYFLQQNRAMPKLPSVYSELRSAVSPDLHPLLDHVAEQAGCNYSCIYNALFREKEANSIHLSSRLMIPLECATVLAGLPGGMAAIEPLYYAIQLWCESRSLSVSDKQPETLINLLADNATVRDYNVLMKVSRCLHMIGDTQGANRIDTAIRGMSLEHLPQKAEVDVQHLLMGENDWS